MTLLSPTRPRIAREGEIQPNHHWHKLDPYPPQSSDDVIWSSLTLRSAASHGIEPLIGTITEP